MDNREESALAAAQSSLFALLSRCFMRPDKELAADIAAKSISAALQGVLSPRAEDGIAAALDGISSFERSCEGVAEEEIRLRMEVDYNRLFVGPAALLAPPYGSYYASESKASGSGRLRTEEERAVAEAYLRYGYALPRPLVELPDHIAVELEFLSKLGAEEAAAWEAGDDARAGALQTAQMLFLEDHVAPWADRLAERVAAGASTTFYPGVAGLAASFCR